MQNPATATYLCLAITCALAGGCAGKLEDPQRFAAANCDDPTAFVAASCGVDGCHVAGNLLNIVDLNSPGLAARLVNQPPLMCANGGSLIDSADRTQSFLLDKLATVPKCGESMPFLRPPLSASEKACVAKFVDQMLVGM